MQKKKKKKGGINQPVLLSINVEQNWLLRSSSLCLFVSVFSVFARRGMFFFSIVMFLFFLRVHQHAETAGSFAFTVLSVAYGCIQVYLRVYAFSCLCVYVPVRIATLVYVFFLTPPLREQRGVYSYRR